MTGIARIVVATTPAVGPKLGRGQAVLVGADEDGNEVATGQVVNVLAFDRLPIPVGQLVHLDRPGEDWIIAVSRCK